MRDYITVIIIGCGARGKETYGRYAMKENSKMKIVAICDVNEANLKSAKEEFGLSDDACFTSSDELLSLGKIADCAIIANYDQEHFGVTMKAIDLGYDILLEKPISNDPVECIKIREFANLKKVNITVCHVMRYTSYYMYLKKLLKEKTIGEIIALEQTEDVSYWHMAHAFVRGNFRSSKTTSPMILQKCCHDFDLIMYLTEEEPISVSSVGDLRYYKKENAPSDSCDYCYKCKRDCPFNAVNFYLGLYDDKVNANLDVNTWPLSQVANPVTKDNLLKSLKSSNWGRCVFHSDNDVVDHQFTTIKLEKGTIATLTMIGFSLDGGRQTHVYGTNGEIYLDEQRRVIEVSQFGKTKKVISFDDLSDDFTGHGGGDNEMMREFVEFELTKSREMLSSINLSVNSHVLAYASEYSRVNDGKCISIKDYEKGILGNEN